MAKSRSVEVCWDYDGNDYIVTANVTPGRPMRAPDMNQPGEPPEPAEVEIVAVHEDNDVGALHTELEEMAAKDEALLDKCVEEMESEEYDPPDRDDFEG
jgi:hypothetical protein